MSIPVFHDDQHGTAIISGAALLNALEVVGKDISKVRVVFNGAGASGLPARNIMFNWACVAKTSFSATPRAWSTKAAWKT